MTDRLDQEIEVQLERLGFELVELERAGSRARPILKLRIDRPDASPGKGVSLEDCTRVSRALEAALEERREVPDRYVLEVSSPGIERPLVRRRDFDRFRGREIAVLARTSLPGGGKRVEGELLGIAEDEGGERIRLRTAAGEEIEIPREATKKVHLVHRWGGEGRD
jgi:ribosome maturation factor RimP